MYAECKAAASGAEKGCGCAAVRGTLLCQQGRVHVQISTNIDYISIMPAAVNTSLGYTAIYGAHVDSQAALSSLPEDAGVFFKRFLLSSSATGSGLRMCQHARALRTQAAQT